MKKFLLKKHRIIGGKEVFKLMRLSKIFRSILHTFSNYAVITVLLLLWYGVGNLPTPNLIALICVPISFLFIFNYLATRLPKITSKEDCKKVFEDVSGYGRRVIVLISFIELVLLLLAVSFNYNSCLSYVDKYPNAEELFRKEFNLSDASLVVMKSLPSPLAEDLYNTAEELMKANYLEDSEKLSSEEMLEKLTSIEDDILDKSNKYRILSVIGFLTMFAYSYCYDTIKRCQQYHTTMRKLEGASNEIK